MPKIHRIDLVKFLQTWSFVAEETKSEKTKGPVGKSNPLKKNYFTKSYVITKQKVFYISCKSGNQFLITVQILQPERESNA